MVKANPIRKANYNAAQAEPAAVTPAAAASAVSTGTAAREFLTPADCAGMRLDQVLVRLLPEYSRSRLQSWVQSGSVLVDGKMSEAKAKLWGGEELRITPQADRAVSAYAAEDIALPVVFEDDAVIVIDKPAGLVVHPGSGNWAGTMLNALLNHAPHLEQVPRAGIVHRLDKETSGLLVVAKTLTAQTDLVRQLQAHTVHREYIALAAGRVESDGEVDAPIGRHPVQRTRMAVVAGGKPARTHYRVIEEFAKATLLECKLETGRTHQIRVHLASIGHPLVGDPVYASKRAPLPPELLRFPRQALHAARLGFIHPVRGEQVVFESPLPQDFATLLESLRGAA
jgi:23S rRNA pseudouridine1911/1915/1917 synthase